MVLLIKELIKKDIAYKGEDGTWYFSIEKFPNYGKLANMKMDELKVGVRMAQDEYEKDAVHDFALWKAWTPEDGDVFWEEPVLGKGRPGWHIECSAMSMKYLGNHFDIHTGGVDNMFPHHENEIAQSEAATGEKFVNLWMHSEFLVVEGKKMAKSAGNFFTLRQLLEKGYHPIAVRFLLLTTHYKKKLNFTWDGLSASASNLQKIWSFVNTLRTVNKEGELSTYIQETSDKTLTQFEMNLDNDLNISGAMGFFFDMMRDVNRYSNENELSTKDVEYVLNVLSKLDSVLGFIEPPVIDEIPSFQFENEEKNIEELIELRINAKKQKDFAKADSIRDFLTEQGYILEDSKDGTKWKKKI